MSITLSDAGNKKNKYILSEEEIQRVIKQDKNKKQTLFIRGARKIKKRIKGMKPWWPFGGK